MRPVDKHEALRAANTLPFKAQPHDPHAKETAVVGENSQT